MCLDLDSADGEFSDDQMPRLPPVGPPSLDSNVVCSQPARNLSRPDGLEEPEEQANTVSGSHFHAYSSKNTHIVYSYNWNWKGSFKTFRDIF